LAKAGFEVDRQRGSHVTVVRADPFAALTVPMHAEIHVGTLRAIIRDAGLSVDEFKALLD
jgi:predicted RNA binding protein YcfA (HicA-like mRNA interferase family)